MSMSTRPRLRHERAVVLLDNGGTAAQARGGATGVDCPRCRHRDRRLAATVVAWQAAPLLGWDADACVFLALVWSAIGRLDAKTTAAVAALEDRSVGVADLVIVIAG
jgi:hypothetical protein